MSQELSNDDLAEVDSPSGAPIPTTFGQYLRSMGPGIIVVLTWLGAGDIVECGVWGGNYGYALMWLLVVALMMRFLFVSLIAKYQLCNQHGEGCAGRTCQIASLVRSVSNGGGDRHGAYLRLLYGRGDRRKLSSGDWHRNAACLGDNLERRCIGACISSRLCLLRDRF